MITVKKHKWTSMAPPKRIPLFLKKPLWKNNQTKKIWIQYVPHPIFLNQNKQAKIIKRYKETREGKRQASWLAKSKNPYKIDPAEEQFRRCKTVSDICEFFQELTYVSVEKILTCSYFALYPHKVDVEYDIQQLHCTIQCGVGIFGVGGAWDGLDEFRIVWVVGGTSEVVEPLLRVPVKWRVLRYPAGRKLLRIRPWLRLMLNNIASFIKVNWCLYQVTIIYPLIRRCAKSDMLSNALLFHILQINIIF